MYDMSGACNLVSAHLETPDFSNASDEWRPAQASAHDKIGRDPDAPTQPAKTITWSQRLELLVLRDIALDVTECVFGFTNRKERCTPQDLDVFKVDQKTVIEAGQVRLAKTSTLIKPVLVRQPEENEVPGPALWSNVTSVMAKAA